MEFKPAIVSMAENNEVQLGGDHQVFRHCHVIGSPVHLQHILLNVLSNAIKYNKPGGSVEVWGEERPIDENHSNYVFTIYVHHKGTG